MSSWLLIVAGCGRFDFAELHDAATAPFTCSTQPASGSITVTGKTFRYTNFMNQVAALDGVGVELLRDDGSTVAMTTSDGSGNYSIAAMAGELVHFRFMRATYQTSLVYSDMPLDRDTAATAQPLFALGDGPLWQVGAIDSIYSTAGVTRDPTRGTLNIGIRDCAGSPIEGVSFVVDPAPEVATYQGGDGMPDATLTETVAPFAHYIGLNTPAGPVQVVASKDGLRFGELRLELVAQTSTLGIVHGGP